LLAELLADWFCSEGKPKKGRRCETGIRAQPDAVSSNDRRRAASGVNSGIAGGVAHLRNKKVPRAYNVGLKFPGFDLGNKTRTGPSETFAANVPNEN
jgi:hypothetical protein